MASMAEELLRKKCRKMKIIYDPEADALKISLFEGKAVESEEILPDVILDYSEEGKIISVEILRASKNVAKLKNIDKFMENLQAKTSYL